MTGAPTVNNRRTFSTHSAAWPVPIDPRSSMPRPDMASGVLDFGGAIARKQPRHGAIGNLCVSQEMGAEPSRVSDSGTRDELRSCNEAVRSGTSPDLDRQILRGDHRADTVRLKLSSMSCLST